ncbi:polypyrimidine tract-binding protein homolog 3 [Tanacetum coccineum]|uniref:Polypyrimidine tract-binding protein homolog 3 n=1 Tax=Tanacetum coccineum TaxID=301880 RepID=A0ABQ5AKL7_9ASTR
MPTTLEEAFSLSRIAEARYEDERPTIAIAKPNNVTARVQVQDLEQTTQGRGDKPNHILLVTIHHMLYPITVEVLHQVFSPYGYVKKVVIFHKSSPDEVDNTKSPLFVDTYGNGGHDSETSGLVIPAEEVVDSGHSFTFSSLVKHGSPRVLQPWEIIGADASANYGDRSAVPGGRRITRRSLVGMDVVLLYALGSERWKKIKVEVLRPRKRKAEEEKGDEMDGNAIANLQLALADGVLSSIEEKKSAK